MSARAWLLFAAVSLLWGMPYLFIRVAVAEVSPPVLVFARVAIAVVVLLPIAAKRGALAGLGRRWRGVLALALLEVVVPFLLITTGERTVPSGLTGLLIASEPLFVALLAAWWDGAERPGAIQMAGLLVGFGGAVVLLGGGIRGETLDPLGAAMILAASACYAAGVLYLNRRFGDVPALGSVTAALGASALLLLVPALASLPAVVPSDAALASLAALGLLCTAGGFVCFFSLIATAGPARATVITYVAPIVATLLGVLVLDERVTTTTAAGSALILAGSWLATRPAR
jgi:drug/metabolite transporter (DMT)-like permease